eukprot:2142318-Rhodomonas_salina.1
MVVLVGLYTLARIEHQDSSDRLLQTGVSPVRTNTQLRESWTKRSGKSVCEICGKQYKRWRSKQELSQKVEQDHGMQK